MVQQWWDDVVSWFNSDGGQTVITSAIIPFLAIVIGGIIAGLIARSAIKRLMTQHDRELKSAAVAALIAAGRKAATWSTLSAPEKDHVDHQLSEAEVRVRLLPVSGATLAADWSAHQLATMKRNSTSFSFQAEQDLVEFQDGLINWQAKPSRAKKLFAQDLTTWKYESSVPETEEEQLASKQREWSAAQSSSSHGGSNVSGDTSVRTSAGTPSSETASSPFARPASATPNAASPIATSASDTTPRSGSADSGSTTAVIPETADKR